MGEHLDDAWQNTLIFRKCIFFIIKFLFGVETVVDSYPIYISNPATSRLWIGSAIVTLRKTCSEEEGARASGFPIILEPNKAKIRVGNPGIVPPPDPGQSSKVTLNSSLSTS